MERGRVAMEALAEEDDEESFDGSDSEEDTEEKAKPVVDDGDGGVRRKVPNQFDTLCDGVVNAVSLVHATMTELLDLKDSLLMHSLPPNVLANIAVTSGKVYRSITDLNEPVNELVRMVRVYSTPWEEKSAALKKLHEDYESKQRQLNIAIKRLQLVDAHSKRIAREKRIMNWERLFSKLTTTKGHGRRWKFLIENFKEKANKGYEHLQSYIRRLDLSDAEEESESEDEDEGLQSQIQLSGTTEAAESEEGDGEKGDDEGESGSEGDDLKIKIPGQDEESDADDDETVSGRKSSSHSKRVTFKEPIKPETAEKGVWTHEPTFDRLLHVRVMKPEGLDVSVIKCLVSYATQWKKTKRLDPPPEPDTPEPSKPTPSPKKSRGLIGSKKNAEEKKPVTPKKEAPVVWDDCVFEMPQELGPGVKKEQTVIPKHLKIAVNHGPMEEITAMATIELEDLEELDLPSIIVPPPNPDPDGPSEETPGIERRNSTISPIEKLPGEEGNPENEEEFSFEREREKLLADTGPIAFPLYSIHAVSSAGSGVHMPAGTQPLIMFWEKRIRPMVADKKTTTGTAYDLVYDLTGIDLNTTTKEDLHPEMTDEAVSVMSVTPEPVEETVNKDEYDQMMDRHRQDIEMLQQEYTMRIQELEAALEDIKNNPPVVTIERARSPDSFRPPHSPEPTRVSSAPKEGKPRPRPPKMDPKPQRSRKNFKVGKPLPKWGESLPEDFFERQQVLKEEKERRKQELHEKTLLEIQETIERQLAGQYRLSHQGEGEMFDTLKDVSLPAVFMPFKSGTIFNPRAHQYFHPPGSNEMRLSQPPSMLTLPPLPKNKLSVVNLFDLGQNFHNHGPEWLLQQYAASQMENDTRSGRHTPMTPAPTMNPQSAVSTGIPVDPASLSQAVQPPSINVQNS